MSGMDVQSSRVLQNAQSPRTLQNASRTLNNTPIAPETKEKMESVQDLQHQGNPAANVQTETPETQQAVDLSAVGNWASEMTENLQAATNDIREILNNPNALADLFSGKKEATQDSASSILRVSSRNEAIARGSEQAASNAPRQSASTETLRTEEETAPPSPPTIDSLAHKYKDLSLDQLAEKFKSAEKLYTQSEQSDSPVFAGAMGIAEKEILAIDQAISEKGLNPMEWRQSIQTPPAAPSAADPYADMSLEELQTELTKREESLANTQKLMDSIDKMYPPAN